MTYAVDHNHIILDFKEHAVAPDGQTVFRRGVRQLLHVTREVILHGFDLCQHPLPQLIRKRTQVFEGFGLKRTWYDAMLLPDALYYGNLLIRKPIKLIDEFVDLPLERAHICPGVVLFGGEDVGDEVTDKLLLFR